MVGVDVESLNTSIPHVWEISTVEVFLDKYYPEFLIDILTFTLTFTLENNYFQFLSKYYKQIEDTSMGAPWTPAYACLHLGLWEEEVVYTSPMYLHHVHMWRRYIDDVLVVWKGDVESPHKFIDTLNNNDHNISLTYVFDRKQISF